MPGNLLCGYGFRLTKPARVDVSIATAPAATAMRLTARRERGRADQLLDAHPATTSRRMCSKPSIKLKLA